MFVDDCMMYHGGCCMLLVLVFCWILLSLMFVCLFLSWFWLPLSFFLTSNNNDDGFSDLKDILLTGCFDHEVCVSPQC